jgi:hypothetical protein
MVADFLNRVCDQTDCRILDFAEQLLVRRGHSVRLANDCLKALSLTEEEAFDLADGRGQSEVRQGVTTQIMGGVVSPGAAIGRSRW